MFSECQGSMSDKWYLDAMDKQEQHIQFGLLAVALSSNKQRQGELQFCGFVQEEILWNILMRLPLATQCRFRCVCTRWKRVLLEIADAAEQPSRPTCTYKNGGNFSYDCFFCSELSQWFRLPFQPRRHVAGEWVLMAADGGLLCYMSIEKRYWGFLVCNPMTGCYVKIFPEHQNRGLQFLEFSNFIVNLETQTFKLVLMSPNATVTFDSRTLEWKRFQAGRDAFPDLSRALYPYFGFVWKGKIYKSAVQSRTYLAFDVESGTWSALQDIGFPRDCDMTQYFHLGSWKDQVLLAQLHPHDEDPVRVWMLHDGPDAAALTWEKVPIQIPDEMKKLVSELRHCLSHGHEYICFTSPRTFHWVKYTFQTKLWQVMPRPCNRDAERKVFLDDFEWGNFEPQMFMNPKADDHSIRFDGSKFLYYPDVEPIDLDSDSDLDSDLDSDSESEGDHTGGSDDASNNYSNDSDAEGDQSGDSEERS